MIFDPQKQHEDDVIKQVQEYIEKNYERGFRLMILQ
jgi:hypothetical protein